MKDVYVLIDNNITNTEMGSIQNNATLEFEISDEGSYCNFDTFLTQNIFNEIF